MVRIYSIFSNRLLGNNMIYCEYCGSDTELLGSKRIEFAEGVAIREERRKCNKCGHKFYVMLDNKDMENTDGE